MSLVDNKKEWDELSFRIEEEGFDYCFNGYSNWREIKDEEFHRLRLQYINAKELLENYVKKNCIVEQLQ